MVARRLFGFPSIGWRNPFAELDQMVRQMDMLTGGFLGKAGLPVISAKVFPAVNITEDRENYYVRAELPGMKSDEIKLEITGRNLALTGERTIPSEGDAARYHRREREAGRFSRIIALPGDVNADRVEAKLVNGVLTISLAKSEAARPKLISVN